MEEGIFNNGIYWHSITTSLFQGGAIAMAYALLVRLVAPREWHALGMDLRLAHGTLVALFAVWCLIFAILAGLTGLFMTWGLDAVTSVSLTMNKLMFGSFGLLALVVMIWIRFRYGPELWEDASLKVTYVILGLIGSASAIITGSLGGEAALLGTVLVWLYELIRAQPRYPMVMPIWGSIILLVVAAAMVTGAFIVRRTRQGAN